MVTVQQCNIGPFIRRNLVSGELDNLLPVIYMDKYCILRCCRSHTDNVLMGEFVQEIFKTAFLWDNVAV